MYSTLKRLGNGRFHVVSTWNTRGVLVGMAQVPEKKKKAEPNIAMSDTDDTVKQDTDEEDDRDDDYYNENCSQMLIKSSSFDRLC